MAGLTLDFWFDFASTYSYPAIMRIRPLADAAGIAVRLRPFLLGPLFKAQGWDTSPFNLYEAKGRYMWRDLERLCAELGLPFRRPNPFPQNGLTAARLALVGLDEGWGDDFCEGVFRAEFGEGRRIDEAGTLGSILQSLDVNADRGFQSAQSDVTTADGELFWGNDRLEAAIAWAQRAS
jgi:2-hydroxychromene-2-carboxylate isomerase